MTSHQANSALKAYGMTGGLAPSPREREARALLHAANLLSKADASPEQPSRAFLALRDNMRIWNVFKAETGRAHNPLPQVTKQTVKDLCRHVEGLTKAALADPRRQSLRTLAEINRQTAAGLLSASH